MSCSAGRLLKGNEEGRSCHLYWSVVLVTCRFEVGVRVDGYAVGGERRHINSAFYTFRPKDDNTPLPELIPDTEVLDSLVEGGGGGGRE